DERGTMSDEQSLKAIDGEVAALQRRVAELEGLQAKLEALCALSPAFIAVIDRDGIIREAFETPIISAEMVKGGAAMPMASSVRKDYTERCLAVIRESLERRTMGSLDYPIHLGPHEVWCQAACKPLSDDTVLWVAR